MLRQRGGLGQYSMKKTAPTPNLETRVHRVHALVIEPRTFRDASVEAVPPTLQERLAFVMTEALALATRTWACPVVLVNVPAIVFKVTVAAELAFKLHESVGVCSLKELNTYRATHGLCEGQVEAMRAEEELGDELHCVLY